MSLVTWLLYLHGTRKDVTVLASLHWKLETLSSKCIFIYVMVTGQCKWTCGHNEGTTRGISSASIHTSTHRKCPKPIYSLIWFQRPVTNPQVVLGEISKGNVGCCPHHSTSDSHLRSPHYFIWNIVHSNVCHDIRGRGFKYWDIYWYGCGPITDCVMHTAGTQLWKGGRKLR